MNYNLRKGLYLLMAILCVGWVQAQKTIFVSADGTGDGTTESTPTHLQNAISQANDDDLIQMAAGTYTLTEQLVIDKAITLSGATEGETTIQASTDSWSATEASKLNLISIVGGSAENTVTLKYFTVTKSKRSGINAQTPMTTVLETVNLSGNLNGAGMVVHSKVIARSITTEGNGWGGINVDKGTPTYDVSFEFDNNCLFNETYDIYSDDPSEASSSFVSTPNRNWYHGVYRTLASAAPDESTGKFSYKEKRVWHDGMVVEVSDDEKGLFIYANGNWVTVTQGETEELTHFQVGSTENGQSFELPHAWNLSLFGGAKNRSVNDTHVYMQGGTLRNIFGGGYGELATQTQADVNGMSRIGINGTSKITNMLIGGGRYYARSQFANIDIFGKDVNINWLICGGYDAGKTTNTIDTPFEQSVNRVNKALVQINDKSTIAFVCAGGGQGLSYTKESTVSLQNARITGGLLGTGSNGRSDSIYVSAKWCTFERTNAPIEIAAVNRGRVENIKMLFSYCDFQGDASDYYAYAGATYNWSDNGSQPNAAHEITGSVTWEFHQIVLPFKLGLSDGLLGDVNIRGITVEVAPFTYNASGSGVTTAFKVPEGKTWWLQDALCFTEGNQATLQNEGTLDITVFDIDQLKLAMDINANKAILWKGTYTLDKPLVITKPITIEGMFDENDARDITIITANDNTDWPKNDDGTIKSSTANLISIEGDATGTVTLSRLTISNSKASGINAQSAMETVLSNIIVENNANAGLLVHSKVTVNDSKIQYNGWGGINIDNGTPSYTPSLTLDAVSSINEEEGKPQIWSELIDRDPNEIVFAPDNSGWRTVNNDTNTAWLWTNINLTQEDIDDVTYVFANGFDVTVEAHGINFTDIKYGGQILTFYNGKKVYLFGGSNGTDVTSTHITMMGGQLSSVFAGGYKANVEQANVVITGGTITEYLVGGGYGTKDVSADVTTKATLEISDASVHYLISGGYQYAKVKETAVTSNNVTYDYVLGGGFAPTDSGNNLETPYEQNANNVEKSTLSITDGIVNGALCAGGGFSYAYVKSAETTLDGVTINGGLYGAGWDGRTEKTTVNVNGCTFKHKPDADYRTTAALVRGRISDTLIMNFDKHCQFDPEYEVYLGADRDNGDYPAPYAEGVIFQFYGSSLPIVRVSEGMRKVKVAGTPVLMDKFERQASNNTWVTEFNVPQYCHWQFYSDLELTADITTAGNFNVGGICKVATAEQLQPILNNGNKHIQLQAGNYSDFTIPSSDVTINGNNEATINGTITMNQAYYVTLTGLKLNPTAGKAAIITDETTKLTASKNYWGENPDFTTLITGPGKADPSPYYIDEKMTQLAYGDAEITTEETWSEAYDGRNVTVKAGGQLTLGTTMALGTVTIEEGGQLIPAATGEMKAASFVFIPTLDANKWKALGTPFESSILVNSESKTVNVATADANEGIWFASLKEDNQPEIVVKNNYSTAGLWASTEATNYRLVATDVTFAQASEPTAPQSGLQMFVNPNTYNIKLNQSAYILNEEGTVFELTANPTIKAFQSFVLADSNTTATLRSIGTTDPNATGNEFVVKEGYYLTTERGAIVVHTAEPMELYVVAVSGAVVYRGTVTDGQRIAVPTGIYAVNGQMVRVK